MRTKKQSKLSNVEKFNPQGTLSEAVVDAGVPMESDDSLVFLNVPIPRSLRTWLKIEAALAGVKIPDIVVNILKEGRRLKERTQNSEKIVR